MLLGFRTSKEINGTLIGSLHCPSVFQDPLSQKRVEAYS